MPLMPTSFISHGGPDIVIRDTPARHFLEGFATELPHRPRAIVIGSAHFETAGAAVVSDPAPGMIYDFGGFAPELYRMVYPAPGDPELAGRVLDLLLQAGLAPERIAERGFDHGTWTAMMLAFPGADVPIVQVSIDPARDARWHHRLGRALAPLRAEGVLLVGSGHVTHNLKAFFSVLRGRGLPEPDLAGKVEAFTGWFAAKFEEGDEEALLDWKRAAPFAADNHPTDEHLMPLFFAYGAAGPDAIATRVHHSVEYGFFASDAYLFR